MEKEHCIHSMVVNILTLGSTTPSRRPHIANRNNSSENASSSRVSASDEIGSSCNGKTFQSLKIHFEIHNFTHKSRYM